MKFSPVSRSSSASSVIAAHLHHCRPAHQGIWFWMRRSASRRQVAARADRGVRRRVVAAVTGSPRASASVPGCALMDSMATPMVVVVISSRRSPPRPKALVTTCGAAAGPWRRSRRSRRCACTPRPRPVGAAQHARRAVLAAVAVVLAATTMSGADGQALDEGRGPRSSACSSWTPPPLLLLADRRRTGAGVRSASPASCSAELGRQPAASSPPLPPALMIGLTLITSWHDRDRQPAEHRQDGPGRRPRPTTRSPWPTATP